MDGGPLVVVHSFDTPEIESLEPPVFDVRALEIGRLEFAGPAVLVAGVSIDQHLFGAIPWSGLSGAWSVSPFLADPVVLAERDLDGDGTGDILTASASDSSAAYYRRFGDGAFANPAIVETPGWNQGAAAGWFGPTTQGLVTIVEGTLVVVDFATSAAIALDGPHVRPPLATHDVNLDGLDDIVAPAQDGLSVVVYFSQGYG
jgi:hypothetical protein